MSEQSAPTGGAAAENLPSRPEEEKGDAMGPTDEQPAMRPMDATGGPVDLAPPGYIPGSEANPASSPTGNGTPLAQETAAFMTRLHSMSEDIERTMREDDAWKDLVTKAATASNLALSAAFVLMAMKTGLLLSSLLATLPAWRIFDPLPVLSLSRQERQEVQQRAAVAAHEEDEDFGSLGHLLEHPDGAEEPSAQGERGT